MPPPPGTAPTVGWEPVKPQREVAPGLSFADTISRFVAFFVDTILLAIVAGIVGAVLGLGETVTSEAADGSSTSYRVTGAAFSILVVVLSLAYFVFFWTGGRRATIGQRIFNIQVGNAFDGRGLTFEQAVRRWLGLGLSIGLLALDPVARSARRTASQLIWVARAPVHDRHEPDQAGPARPVRQLRARPAGRRRARGARDGLRVIVGLLILIFVDPGASSR